MATDSVSGVPGLGQDQFLQLLIAQLQNQDPLEPVSDRDFIAQLASFSTLQGIQTLNASFSQMLLLQQITQGTDLIGRTVEFKDSEGTSQTGKVDSLSVQSGNIVLQIGDTQVALDQITKVQA